MDFRLNPGQSWNTYSRFQGAVADADEELQGLTAVSPPGAVQPGRSAHHVLM